jgi:hypothetical protein
MPVMCVPRPFTVEQGRPLVAAGGRAGTPAPRGGGGPGRECYPPRGGWRRCVTEAIRVQDGGANGSAR